MKYRVFYYAIFVCVVFLLIKIYGYIEDFFYKIKYGKSEENSYFEFEDEIIVRIGEGVEVYRKDTERIIVENGYSDEISVKGLVLGRFYPKEKKVKDIESEVVFDFEYKNVRRKFCISLFEDETNIKMAFYQQKDIKIYVGNLFEDDCQTEFYVDLSFMDLGLFRIE